MPAINVDSYPRFHLAFPVTDLARTHALYGEFLNYLEGRSSPEWADFNFHGHQFKAFEDMNRIFAK
ncbi:MAG TPA: hypothetical protein VM532_17880 [Burkholderiales bacterium]|nr:hypothetical protein [Burkholderiales bacterium]